MLTFIGTIGLILTVSGLFFVFREMPLQAQIRGCDQKIMTLLDHRKNLEEELEVYKKTKPANVKPKGVKPSPQPNIFRVYFDENSFVGMAVENGEDVRACKDYKRFLKWYFTTDKPHFTFYYSDKSSATILRKNIYKLWTCCGPLPGGYHG